MKKLKSDSFAQDIKFEDIISLEELNEDLFTEFKYKGKTITVKTFLMPEEVNELVNYCISNFFEDFDPENLEVNKLPAIKSIFDLLVLRYSANIEIDFDDPEAKYLRLLSSRFLQDILKLVENREEIWHLIEETINHQITIHSLNLVASHIPTSAELDSSMEQMGATLEALKKSNPELMELLINKTVAETTKQAVREERKTQKPKPAVEETTRLEKIREDIDSAVEGR